MRQNVYLDGDTSGPWMGHVLGEVGCIWLGEVQSDVIVRAPGEISRYLKWLRSHGEPGIETAEPAAVKAHVVEIQEVPGFGQSGQAVGFFGPDRQPAGDQEIAMAVRRLGYARRDLLTIIAGLSPEVLDWQPPARLSVHEAGQAVLRPATPKRTIRQNLEHVTRAQAFYLSRILEYGVVAAALPDPWPKDTLTCLDWVLGRATEVLLCLPRQVRGSVFRAAEPAEDWTARKVLRRFVEHEREHIEVVRKTLQHHGSAGRTGD